MSKIGTPATMLDMDWKILGHEWAARLLQQNIAHKQARHAYLLTGPAGVGRRTLALRFAQALNCTQPPQPGAYCGRCRACVQTEKMQHPDLIVVQAEKTGGSLLIDQVRALEHALSLTPYEARWRVGLVLRFEEATLNAQNALLKTLEEAPKRAVLLLTASDAESLLPTIVSRCETLRLRPMPLEKLEKALVQNWHVPLEEARQLAHLSGGRLGLAVRLHTDPELLEARLELAADVFRLLTYSRRARFAYVEERAKDRARLRWMLEVWSSVWRDVMLSAAGTDIPLVNLALSEEIEALARGVEFSRAAAAAAALEDGAAKLDANINPRLLVENILLGW
ncbi:MAG: DNA polymerase III subunit delta' [Anaerolineaceae bacterium]|nr:DNA polymerase III subunit delta' [Anaerolineaceae bacterium]